MRDAVVGLLACLLALSRLRRRHRQVPQIVKCQMALHIGAKNFSKKGQIQGTSQEEHHSTFWKAIRTTHRGSW